MKAQHLDIIHWAEEQSKKRSKEEIENFFGIKLKSEKIRESNGSLQTVYNIYHNDKPVFYHVDIEEINNLIQHFAFFNALNLLHSAVAEGKFKKTS